MKKKIYKKYKLEELFDISTTKSINKNNIDFCKDGDYEFIGRTAVNNGVQGYVKKLAYEPNPGMTFSVVQVGETCCLFREKEWYASQNIFILKPKIKEIPSVALIVSSCIDKALSKYKKDAYIYPSLRDLKSLIILLPSITPPGDQIGPCFQKCCLEVLI